MNLPSLPKPRLAALLGASLTVLATAGEARAEGFATPPDEGRAVAISPSDRYVSYGDLETSRRPSLVRLLVGPAGKVDARSTSPGLLAAIDVGRGPTGFRLTGAWLDVGADHGLSQYTGEITLDFGGRSRWRPVIGAGGG